MENIQGILSIIFYIPKRVTCRLFGCFSKLIVRSFRHGQKPPLFFRNGTPFVLFSKPFFGHPNTNIPQETNITKTTINNACVKKIAQAVLVVKPWWSKMRPISTRNAKELEGVNEPGWGAPRWGGGPSLDGLIARHKGLAKNPNIS